MADALVCRAKTFLSVQIFARNQNKRKATITLCTVETRDCGTPQHLNGKSNTVLQNKTGILWIGSCTTRVLAKGWHREISKCWGVLHRTDQVIAVFPFLSSFVPKVCTDPQSVWDGNEVPMAIKMSINANEKGRNIYSFNRKSPELTIQIFIHFPCYSRCSWYSSLTMLGCYSAL